MTDVEKKQTPVEAVINLCPYSPVIVTVYEYESIVNEINARALARDTTVGDSVLANLLAAGSSRYYEAKEINKQKGLT